MIFMNIKLTLFKKVESITYKLNLFKAEKITAIYIIEQNIYPNFLTMKRQSNDCFKHRSYKHVSLHASKCPDLKANKQCLQTTFSLYTN